MTPAGSLAAFSFSFTLHYCPLCFCGFRNSQKPSPRPVVALPHSPIVHSHTVRVVNRRKRAVASYSAHCSRLRVNAQLHTPIHSSLDTNPPNSWRILSPLGGRRQCYSGECRRRRCLPSLPLHLAVPSSLPYFFSFPLWLLMSVASWRRYPTSLTPFVRALCIDRHCSLLLLLLLPAVLYYLSAHNMSG